MAYYQSKHMALLFRPLFTILLMATLLVVTLIAVESLFQNDQQIHLFAFICHLGDRKRPITRSLLPGIIPIAYLRPEQNLNTLVDAPR